MSVKVFVPRDATACALGAYLLSGGAPEVVDTCQLLVRLRKIFDYEMWGIQFGGAGAPAPIFYDALIDSRVVPEAERPVLRARPGVAVAFDPSAAPRLGLRRDRA